MKLVHLSLNRDMKALDAVPCVPVLYGIAIPTATIEMPTVAVSAQSTPAAGCALVVSEPNSPVAMAQKPPPPKTPPPWRLIAEARGLNRHKVFIAFGAGARSAGDPSVGKSAGGGSSSSSAPAPGGKDVGTAGDGNRAVEAMLRLLVDLITQKYRQGIEKYIVEFLSLSTAQTSGSTTA